MDREIRHSFKQIAFKLFRLCALIHKHQQNNSMFIRSKIRNASMGHFHLFARSHFFWLSHSPNCLLASSVPFSTNRKRHYTDFVDFFSPDFPFGKSSIEFSALPASMTETVISKNDLNVNFDDHSEPAKATRNK